MTELPFVPSSGTFGDFLIVTQDTSALRETMRRLGASVVERVGHVAYLFNMPAGDVVLSGLGILDGKFVKGPAVLSAAPNAITCGPCNVLSFGAETEISADPFGMLVIYYGATLVTNSLHLSALAVGRLDAPASLGCTYTTHMFCQQLPALRTAVQGVSVLMPGARVRVSGKVEVLPAEPQEYGLLSPAEYHAMIDRGAGEVMANVNAILNTGLPVICDISGGRDSRVIFGAVVALGRVKDVVFNTRLSPNATGQKDVEIGTGLVKAFAGSYFPHIEAEGYVVESIENRMLARRSQIFGTYHFITPGQINQITPIRNPREIKMMGGSGEMLRDYYQRFFTAVAPDAAAAPDNIAKLLASRLPGFVHHEAAVIEVLEETIADMPGQTIGEKLDSHYVAFRNRYHFGPSIKRDQLTLSPIASPSLLRAARGLPPVEKATGRVLFDVTQALCERLPYYPHDKPGYTAFASSPYHRASKFDDAPPVLTPAPELLTAERARPKVRKPAVPRIDLRDLCYTIALENFERLKSGRFRSLCTDALREHIEKAPANRLGSWASKLQALSDYEALLA